MLSLLKLKQYLQNTFLSKICLIDLVSCLFYLLLSFYYSFNNTSLKYQNLINIIFCIYKFLHCYRNINFNKVQYFNYFSLFYNVICYKY
ncbi:hypothetical protein D7S40_13555 [Staphylococcus aureus]|uniref:Transmembrane protein n=1 Tax=Staphylococcus aureus TaxID=1280 RepID=A0A641A3X5_STAAU|nr:hypothetical protein D7S40_13555 [Staphylococcus aureus]